jgi:hemerythrin-like domain-containing protein
MQPIGPLMIEHRLIERLVALMEQDLTRIKENVAVDPEFAFVDPVFLDIAVDFLRTYADRCHHGKEEGILFAALAQRELSSEHKKVMEELIEEHARARQIIKDLVRAKQNHLLGHKGALEEILRYLQELTEFYPKHIDKEDKHFFIPCMAYFSDREKDELLQKMWEFDRQLIHEKYRGVIEEIEQRKSCRI